MQSFYLRVSTNIVGDSQKPMEMALRKQVDEDLFDKEEDALAQDYNEQVHFEDGLDELDRTASFSGSNAGPQDIQAQLAAAATPLEFQASLETKFASYDNYCSLFHYILNSDGPVDLDVPTVSAHEPKLGPPLPTTFVPID